MKRDLYIDLDLALETAKKINSANVWVHDEWEHDAIRKHGKAVMQPMLARLFERM